MRTIRLIAIAPLLIALLGVGGCTTGQAPQATAPVAANPGATLPNATGAIADPCKARLISGYPAGSHAHPVVMLKFDESKDLELAKEVILGSVRSENDKYGFAVTHEELYHYLTSDERECVSSVPGQVDYYLTSADDASDLIGALQLGGPSLFVSNVQNA
jgi:hypothetical protein